jgi:hypothetical protein
MSPAELERELREVSLPGEGAARERARREVLAAHAAAPARRRPRAAAIATAVVLAAIGASSLTRPGQAVGEWLGDRFVQQVVHQPATPRPLPRRQTGLDLPTPGRLLVASARGLWIVDRDGRRTGLGDWTSGTWSPHAYYVAAARGRTLAAVRPDGAVRWRRTLPARVADPRWSPDGFHIAYRAGDRLHLIWGNGRNDVALRGEAAPAAPAWRPSDARTVAWARADGTVIVEDAFTGLVLWRHRGGPVRHLSWSADGRRLLIAGRRHGAVHELASRRTRSLRLAPGEELTAAAFAPAGSRLALAVRDARGTAVRLLGEREPLVEAPHALRELTWSPDARWLLAGWPWGDQWLLVPANGGPPRGIASVARRFGAGTRPLGWCC